MGSEIVVILEKNNLLILPESVIGPEFKGEYLSVQTEVVYLLYIYSEICKTMTQYLNNIK